MCFLKKKRRVIGLAKNKKKKKNGKNLEFIYLYRDFGFFYRRNINKNDGTIKTSGTDRPTVD